MLRKCFGLSAKGKKSEKSWRLFVLSWPQNPDQPARKNNLDLKHWPKQNPDCEACGGTMTQRIPDGLRCPQCAAQWLHPDARPRVSSLSRIDVSNGVRRLRWLVYLRRMLGANKERRPHQNLPRSLA